MEKELVKIYYQEKILGIKDRRHNPKAQTFKNDAI
jgi:hypothetical protein